MAIAKNLAIGKDNDLLWHISADMKWFKKQTQQHPVIMGKRTWESLPKKPLPNRTNIVISDQPGDCFDGCVMVGSIEEAIDRMDTSQENFIIGGGSVYKQFLPLANKLYLTLVHKDFEADTFFPAIDYACWEEIFREDHLEEVLPYSFLIYQRK